MMVHQDVSTNFLSTSFIKNPIYMNGTKVVIREDGHFGAKNSSMFSVDITPPSTVYLLYNKKEKGGVKRVAAKRLGDKVDGGRCLISPTSPHLTQHAIARQGVPA